MKESKGEIKPLAAKDYPFVFNLSQQYLASSTCTEESFLARLGASLGYWGEVILVGYVLVFKTFEVYDIEAVCTDASYRRKGIATKLVNTLQKQLPASSRLMLEVQEDNHHAIGLYKKMDFTIIAERRGYYSDGGNAYIMMWEKGGIHV